MLDIELVIKIPKDSYKATCNGYMSPSDIENVVNAIKNGTPLPKRHGRLIDADALVKKMEEREEKLKDNRLMRETASFGTTLNIYAPTIIEANKGVGNMSCILDKYEPYWCKAEWNCKDCPYWVEDKEAESEK